ncbi:AbrB family transcriptional regulator [Paenibacillus filicis]|uniref:AbrB family transcriptional regulator n=1 Tax=Paenibacillus filicis TaxID=669464 RepID=A0ABU9DVR0_9BACL
MRKLVETAAVTGAGGALFMLLHIPLPWMLGPLTAVMLWQGLVKRQVQWPVAMRNGGLLILGYGMGLSVTMDSLRQIAGQLPSMLGATVLTVAFSLLMAAWIARATGITLASSLVGSVPGGLSQMVVLGEEIPGADKTIVTFMQTIRLLAVIFIVPFLAVHGLAGSGGLSGTAGAASAVAAGASWMTVPWTKALLALAAAVAAAWAAGKLRMPTPWFLGPIIVLAVLTVGGWEPPHLPPSVSLVAQWSLGVYLGAGIRLQSLGSWRRLLPYSLAGGIAVVGFCFLLAYVFSLFQPIGLGTAFLSVAPGGMTEMGVTATLVQADVSMVVAYQMFRILFILFLVPYLIRWAFRHHAKSSG